MLKRLKDNDRRAGFTIALYRYRLCLLIKRTEELRRCRWE